MARNMALEAHIEGPCALRKFAYGPQPAELGCTCECGTILTSKANSAGKPNTLKHHKTLTCHQAFLDSKDSECSECKLLVDQSVGIARHLASPCHKFLKNLSDEGRVRFLTSSLGLEQCSGSATFTKHPRRQSKSISSNVDWRSGNKIYGDIRLKITLGPFVFPPHAITESRMRNNLYLTFTNTLIPAIW